MRLPLRLLILAWTPFLLSSCTAQNQGHSPIKKPALKKPMKDIYVAGGCFWCLEPLFEDLEGVTEVEVGYAGGQSAQTNYREVCGGQTGHAEALRIVYDSTKISAHDLFTIFFTVHNPTTLNQQGPDHGTQYRSAIFYRSEAEHELAVKVKNEITAAKIWPQPIVTSFEPLKNYCRAEEYHQDYYAKYDKATPEERMSMNAGYCSAVVSPKVAKFRKEFAAKLKKKKS